MAPVCLGLTSLPDRPCHVLMAPHHGSLTLDPSELLAWCRPELIVVSGNHRAVREAVLRTYAVASTFVTYRDGAIQLRVHSDGTIRSFHWTDNSWQPLE